MDRTNPQVARFSASLKEIDDDTLAALANKGLVRRARKDIEKTPPNVIGADDAGVVLEVEGCKVRVASPLSQSSCTCASGICRHILSSIVFLREAAAGSLPAVNSPSEPQSQAEPTVLAASPAQQLTDQLLALYEAAMQKWAARPVFKKAAVVLSRGFEVEVAPMILVRLPAQNVTVRLLGASPDAMICSCHAPGVCEHKLAAVLAYQSHVTGRRRRSGKQR